MRNLIKNNDRSENSKKAHNASHIVISGHPIDTLNSEELDIYRFMLGGLQAK